MKQKILQVSALFILFCCASDAYGQQPQTENPDDAITYGTYRPVFRSGHTLSVILSSEFAHWKVSQQQDSRFSLSQPFDLSKRFVFPALFFRYAYYINLLSRVGFFVGSTAGVFLQWQSYKTFSPGYGVLMPTVLFGLNVNLTHSFRLVLGGEYGVIWYPTMSITTGDGVRKKLAAVPDMLATFTGGDYFFGKSTSVSLLMGGRLIKVPSLGGPGSNVYLNTLNIKNTSFFLQFRFVWELSQI